MFSNLKEFFNFNTTERNGILVLLLITIGIAFLPSYYIHTAKPPKVDYRAFEKEIEQFESSLQADSASGSGRYNKGYLSSKSDEKAIQSVLFPFDPNHCSSQEWKQLGFKDWQIRIIDKYMAKGGKFRKKDDLQKIYGITQAQFASLEPFIVLPVDKENSGYSNQKSQLSVKRKFIVDINTADTALLQELKGIGPAFAKRIVKYRDLLGGFYSTTQLLEVYGFDKQKYDLIAENCIVGDGPFRKFNINISTTAELKKHPYLDYYIAKAIADRRVAKGKYNSVEQLRELPLITEELFEKLKHYVIVE